ncbi:hypothetical protein [Mesorhizobium helmanticense]|uniref:hypothetical protein n=1 Tax=Mesorhizobium helmanticense TaxID=1776423 RepID=UPI00142DF1E5|nr:hypothetical protein [Mesorhizobium helmanticense]
MIRLLIAGTIAYAAYRIAKKVIDNVPDDFEPFLPPRDDRKVLRRQSAAMGVEPRR